MEKNIQGPFKNKLQPFLLTLRFVEQLVLHTTNRSSRFSELSHTLVLCIFSNFGA